MRATQNNPLGAVLGAADRPRPPVAVPAPALPAGPNLLRYPFGGDRGPVEPRTGLLPEPSPRVGSTGQPPDGLAPSAGLPKSPFPWVPPASPRLAGFLSGISVSNPQIASPFVESPNQKYNS